MISSTGKAAQTVGGALGQFEYVEDKGYYVQTSTDKSNEKFEAAYLYRVGEGLWTLDGWYVGPRPGVRGEDWLYNELASKTPPTRDWEADQWWPENPPFLRDQYHFDTTLTVSPGPLPPLPEQFRVTASGDAAERWPSITLGVFTRTERWWLGRPVYANNVGQLLYHGPRDLGWVIGPSLGGRHYLRGSRARHSPASEVTWRYWSGSEDKLASVTVTAMENQNEKDNFDL